jgi:hypothetical protein
LNEGANVIELRKADIGTGGWTQFDFHRFEVLLIPEPAGLLLAMLGIVCLIGRRSPGRRRY